MVQLIVVTLQIFAIWLLDFNSTMVQLIVPHSAPERRDHTLFQFYYGSINRDLSKNILSLSLAFQFYYGSINRMSRFLLSISQNHFNSTMVQLIATSPNNFGLSGKNFNSTMVQLIVNMGLMVFSEIFNFNSTMVQLIGPPFIM